MSTTDPPTDSPEELTAYLKEEYNLFEGPYLSYRDHTIVTVSISEDGDSLVISPAFDGSIEPEEYEIKLKDNETILEFVEFDLEEVPEEAIESPVTYRQNAISLILNHTEFVDSEGAGFEYTWHTTTLVENDTLAKMDVSRDEILEVLADLIALERDRELGFKAGELHREPQAVLQEACKLVAALDYNPDDVVLPEDQETLGINLESGGEDEKQSPPDY